jgi:serine/threonine-protein phosphatase 2A regulatory subunit A
MCTLLRKDLILDKVMPSLRMLVTDTSEHVRASMAGVINDLAPILGRDDTVEQLLPMLLELLRDESSDVRLNIISNLDTSNGVVGVELLNQSLLPALVDLAEDSKWRVRFAIIELIPRVAEQLGCDFFNEKLNNLCMVWMGDDVYSIRRAAANNLFKLADLFGEEWAKEQIFPRIERMHIHTNYLQRMTALYIIQVLAKVLSVPTLENLVVPLILHMVGDAVPNVRLTVARTLKDIVSSSGGNLQDSSFLDSCIVPALQTLSADPDRDVRFYSMTVSYWGGCLSRQW